MILNNYDIMLNGGLFILPVHPLKYEKGSTGVLLSNFLDGLVRLFSALSLSKAAINGKSAHYYRLEQVA